MKPKRLHGPTIKRLTLEGAEIAGWLAARAVPISAANDFIDDGRKGVDYSAVKRGGQESTGPERYALSGRSDDVGQMAGEFMGTLERWHRDGRRLRALGVKLSVEWDEASLTAAEGVARRSADPAASGECANPNCKRLISGSRNDRIVHGRCGPCFRWWDRHGRVEERPRELCIKGQCRSTATVNGVDVECVLAAGHPCEDPETDHSWEPVDLVA